MKGESRTKGDNRTKGDSRASGDSPANGDSPAKGGSEGPEHLTRSERGEPVTVLEAISEALYEEMTRDEAVFLMGEDIGAYGGAFKVTRGFLEHFGPERVIDVPIAEGGFTGAAAGAAHVGLRPVVEMQFMDFVSPAYDVITNYIATSAYRGAGKLPLVIRGPVGGGGRGGPFHSQNVEMAFFHTPGLKIVYPSTARDAKALLKASIRDEGPVIFEEHKMLYRDPGLRSTLPFPLEPVQLGKAATVRGGSDLSIITYGAMVHRSLSAAEQLADSDGVQTHVTDLRTLLPLDNDAIGEAVRNTGRVLIVHEDTRTGGIAGEISMRINELAFEWLDAPVVRVTAIDAPVPFAAPLEDHFLPTRHDIVQALRYLADY